MFADMGLDTEQARERFTKFVEVSDVPPKQYVFTRLDNATPPAVESADAKLA
jgi:hypothetical protein